MALKDILKDKDIVYCGAKESSGFWFIGKAQNLIDKLDDFNIEKLNYEKSLLSNAKNTIKIQNELLSYSEEEGKKMIHDRIVSKHKREKKEDYTPSVEEVEKEYKRWIRAVQRRKESATTTKKKQEKIIKEWIPLKDRLIADCYKRITEVPDADIIIVDGVVHGGYWFRYEFEEQFIEEEYNDKEKLLL